MKEIEFKTIKGKSFLLCACGRKLMEIKGIGMNTVIIIQCPKCKRKIKVFKRLTDQVQGVTI